MPTERQAAGQIIRVEGIPTACFLIKDAKTLYSEPEDDIKTIWNLLVDEYVKETENSPFTAKNGQRYLRDGDLVLNLWTGQRVYFCAIDDAINYVSKLLTINFTPTPDKLLPTRQELAQIIEAESAALTEADWKRRAVSIKQRNMLHGVTAPDDEYSHLLLK